MEIIEKSLEFLIAITTTQTPYAIVITLLFLFGAFGLFVTIVSISNAHTLQKKKKASMNRVEQTFDIIYSKLKSHYLTFAKDVLGDNWYDTLEVKYYTEYILHEMLLISHELFKEKVLSNGFDIYTSDEWANYVRLNVVDAILDMRNTKDELYPSEAIIKRPDLYTYNTPLWENELKKELETLYNDLLKICKNHKLKSVIGWKVNF